jgi:hypothetical protein
MAERPTGEVLEQHLLMNSLKISIGLREKDEMSPVRRDGN